MSQAQEPVTISIRAKAGQRDLIDQRICWLSKYE